jgi:hypothetical protein
MGYFSDNAIVSGHHRIFEHHFMNCSTEAITGVFVNAMPVEVAKALKSC